MRTYRNKPMAELAAELSAGLVRLRKGYVDAAEALIQILDPAQEYPYEFVVYRLTGYRPRPSRLSQGSMTGESLRGDLLTLMLDVCDSFDLPTSAYVEPVYGTAGLARHFSVSTKTVQRWRKRGLPARRLVFPDGVRRVAVLAGSVEWFGRYHRGQIQRSMRFTQMTAEEREDILRRARRLARRTRCSLSEVAKRISRRTGRAVETVRYTIRKHDIERPADPIFSSTSRVLTEEEKETVYRGFLSGVPAPALAKRYRRTRGSIYRIVAERRAKQLLERPIPCVYNPQFDLPNADEIILAAPEPAETGPGKPARVPADLPPYLSALYEVPLLNAEAERDLFRRLNYVKYKADKLRKDINPNRVRTSQLQEIESYLLQANVLKNRIIRANLRLVVSIAKRHVGGPQTLFELISDGNVSLMRAVEKFDYSRGFRFSTYSSWAIMRSFARSVPKERYHLDRFATGHDEVLDIAAGLRSYDPNEVNLPELRESIDALLSRLTPRERAILTDHYGLDDSETPKTLDQLSHDLGLSKERVRQIELHALRKLRGILKPEQAGLSL